MAAGQLILHQKVSIVNEIYHDVGVSTSKRNYKIQQQSHADYVEIIRKGNIIIDGIINNTQENTVQKTG
jgi:hypothetical protein